ncbi:MAG: helix-turn-helix transcriptional regulator [Ruminococcus sp.]|nr:helix-turn-helix transcriptional regulator [Ruminococcus sp.]
MGKKSIKKDKTIYQIVREELGLSRAEATEYIPDNPVFPGMSGITENMLVKMESGTTTIQPGDVVAMAKRYNCPELRNHYCCYDCEIGIMDAPKVTFKTDVHEILVNMAVSLRIVNHNKIRLMEILQDEKVTLDEIEEFNAISKELEHISMTIEALQLWCEKMKITAKE